MEKVDELLNKKAEKSKAEYFPPTLDGAIKVEKNLNMAVISVPGRFAADVAKDCLDRDINVMLFSDNVTIEEEKVRSIQRTPDDGSRLRNRSYQSCTACICKCD